MTMGSGLNLTLHTGNDVYVGDRRFFIKIEKVDRVKVVSEDGKETFATPYEWVPLQGAPGAEVMVAQLRGDVREDKLLETRLLFNAPGQLILRGPKYRRGKEQVQ
jgi:hypothetical protein